MLNPTSPVSPNSAGRKRLHPIAEAVDIPLESSAQSQRQYPTSDTSAAIASASSASAFRNVSACNRCRRRKNRCDQRLPRCESCEKVGVRCVGYDPITKREVPRSYVYFLEARVAYLEALLMDREIEFKQAIAFDEEEAATAEAESASTQRHMASSDGSATAEVSAVEGNGGKLAQTKKGKGGLGLDLDNTTRSGRDTGNNDLEKDDNWRIQNLVSNIGMVSVQGTSDPRYLGSTSGISFARVVFAAVKSSVPGNVSERDPMPPKEQLPHSATGTGGSTMRDSFFGLQTRPMMKCAAFPDRELAERLADLYFEHANPQIPILHRVDFMELLDRTYSVDEKNRSPRSLYILNIVFAIGAGIIFEDKPAGDDQHDHRDRSPSASAAKRPRLSSHQYQPEEYHASAVIHLESFLSTSSSNDGFGALKELQAVLLLASFALLRPVAPGLWYIVGVAMRLAVDLGLHYEDGTGIDAPGNENLNRSHGKGENKPKPRINTHERGRRECVRDLRRRLWWCVYSFDRLVSCCVGRPFGISDQAISTEFPSVLDDKYITKAGIIKAPAGAPSYKHAAFHYFKLRLLQSEIQDVLQHHQARFARQRVPHAAHFMRSDVVSPFLQGFDSFRSWRKDVHRRLAEWKQSTPTPQDTGVRFPVEFLELNYWQAVIMLYQQSLTVPAELADEVSPAEDVSSPSFSQVDEDDEDDIYYKVAEAGQKVIRIYRQMHRVRLVNYTYLATHHIFMAGISFLYAIWHSPWVRSRLTLDEVDFTVLAATSVLRDLMHKCPPAEACRDAFERMSKATVEMSLSTTGFGPQVDLSRFQTGSNASKQTHMGQSSRSRQYARQPAQHGAPRSQLHTGPSPPVPRFDMNLGDILGGNNDIPERQISYSMGKPVHSYPVSETSDPNFTSERSGMPPPPQRTPSIEYYGNYENPVSPHAQLHQQQQQQYYHGNSPQLSGSPSSVGPNSGLSQFQTIEHENPSGMGLEFLGYDSAGITREMSMGSDETPDYNLQAMSSPGHGAGHSVGIDLGFGMAVDFQHDWSENANYDLFEGYFFGSSGQGPGAAGI